MQIAIFGATGRLGRELMHAALARGHAVIAHSRRARSEPAPGVTWVSGDPGPAVQDADAVLIAFGPRSPQDAPFCQSETRKIIEAMRALGRRRLVCVTGAIIGDYGANRTWCFQRLALWIQRRYQAMLDDRASGLEWTIFKPPRLTTKPPKSAVEAGAAIRVGLLSSVSRGGLARLMVHEAEERRFVGQAVFAKEY